MYYNNQEKLERIRYEHTNINKILRFNKKEYSIAKSMKEYLLNNDEKFV